MARPKAPHPTPAELEILKLLWESGATKSFQFDRLAREPRLTRAGGGTEAAPGVRLVPLPGSTIPKLPSLLPTVIR